MSLPVYNFSLPGHRLGDIVSVLGKLEDNQTSFLVHSITVVQAWKLHSTNTSFVPKTLLALHPQHKYTSADESGQMLTTCTIHENVCSCWKCYQLSTRMPRPWCKRHSPVHIHCTYAQVTPKQQTRAPALLVSPAMDYKPCASSGSTLADAQRVMLASIGMCSPMSCQSYGKAGS